MTNRLDLPLRYREQLEALLREHVPSVEVWAYGSRVNGQSHDGSDLNLVLRGPTLEPLGCEYFKLVEALEHSNIPVLVQTHDWARLPESFHREIQRNYAVLQAAQVEKSNGEWHEASWGDLVTLEYGKSLREYRDSTGPYRVYGTNGPVGWNGQPLCHYPSVIVGRKGAYRGIHYSPEPFFVIDTAFYVKPKVEIDTRWAYYQLLTQDINGLDSGSAIPSTSREDFYALPVSLPPLPEQHAIAGILGALDDKIELNRRMNETLEQMARALFQSWFVDFEPVRAKMAGREPNLPPDLWALFPDRLVDLESGEIPEGWAAKTLGEICKKPQYGYTASAQSDPVGPKFLRITDINKTPWIEWGNVPFCAISDGDLQKFLIRNGDVLIARMADPGHGVMVEEDLDAVFASYLIRFRPANADHGRLLQYWLKSASYWELVQSRGAGTTRISLNAKVLSGFPLVIPSDAVAKRFAQAVHSIRSRIVVNVAETEALAAQRDALLPRLVSGEIVVNSR